MAVGATLFPSYCDTFGAAFPRIETEKEKKAHAYPRGNICFQTTKRTNEMTPETYAQMVQENGGLVACL